MHNAGLTLAIALAAGVLAQSVSRQVRVSGIVLLLLTGALLGPEAASWIDPRTLGVGLFSIVDFGIAIILFEGGLNLQWSRLKRQEAAIRRLITGGALITLVGATVLARFAVGWQWDLSLLFGSLVVVTGPSIGFRSVIPSSVKRSDAICTDSFALRSSWRWLPSKVA